MTHILFVLIIFQLLFLSFYLLTQRRGKKISNVLLAFFFLSISLNLLDLFLMILGVYYQVPFLLGWGSCLPLLFGPLIYLYTESVIQKKFRITAWKKLHFIPFIVIFFCTESYFLLQSRNFQESLLAALVQHHIPLIISVFSTLIFIQFLIYIVASFRLVYRYKQDASQYFSNERQINVSWLSSAILFFLAIILISIINGLLTQTAFAGYFLFGFTIVIFAMLLFILHVLFKALQKPYFFSFPEDTIYPSKSNPGIQFANQDADNTEKKKIAERVLNYMQTGKPYLDPDLTLEQLASQLALKPRILSQAINEIIGKNFFHFINHYRIEEASRLLTNPKDKKITILEVLYEVGFNSKSSFNTLFKKYTGLTPSDFRKKQSL